MKEVIVHPLPTLTTEIHDAPIPIPESDQVIIKVVVAGSNVKGKSIRSRVFLLGKADEIIRLGSYHRQKDVRQQRR
jgi:hypothetical protein